MITITSRKVDGEYKVGERLELECGNCTITRVFWKKHSGPQIDVKFEDGECCRYAYWQIDLLQKYKAS